MNRDQLFEFLEAMAEPTRDPVTLATSERALEAADLYLALDTDDRKKIIAQLGSDKCMLLGRYVPRFCADAIDMQSPRYVFPAIMALEISSVSTDWRLQLVRLLVVDHALDAMRSAGLDFDMQTWQQLSSGTYKSYLQLDERSPALRSIHSVGLSLIEKDGHSFFQSAN